MQRKDVASIQMTDIHMHTCAAMLQLVQVGPDGLACCCCCSVDFLSYRGMSIKCLLGSTVQPPSTEPEYVTKCIKICHIDSRQKSKITYKKHL